MIKTCVACGSAIGATRPTHVHVCTADDTTHTWQCDSAYCNGRDRDCVEHGGEKPRSD